MPAGHTLLRKLSDGAAAEVFLARSARSSQPVLLEILRQELVRDPEVHRRFVEEGSRRRGFNHPHLARRVDAGVTTEGRPYVLSEPVGEDLATYLSRSGRLPPDAVRELAVALCGSLGFLHEKGLVHGNLKPGSVFVSQRDGLLHPQLIDYGLALLRPGRSIPVPASRVLVEPEYLAPERIAGTRATVSSDVYSLGLLMFEALTGAPPFRDEDPAETRRMQVCDVPPRLAEGLLPAGFEDLAEVVLRCLEKDPAHRFTSVAAVRSALSGNASGRRGPRDLREPTLELSVQGTREVFGSYELLQPLGEGAMGRVYLARHVRLGRLVALKLLKPEFARDAVHLQRFFQEARAVNQINHEHIVEIFDFIDELAPDGSRRVYCVMEVLRGDTMSELARRGPMPLARTVQLIRQVCEALDAAHALGVVHRDIKPDNIFITQRSGADFVKVLDFGVAKLRDTAPPIGTSAAVALMPPQTPVDITAAGTVVGTPLYMAPEQAMGQQADPRSDIYALGTVLYRLLSGRAPFAGAAWLDLMLAVVRNPPAPMPATTPGGEPIPEALAQVVMSCLAKDPAQRPQSMRALSSALERFVLVQPVAADLASEADAVLAASLVSIVEEDELITAAPLAARPARWRWWLTGAAALFIAGGLGVVAMSPAERARVPEAASHQGPSGGSAAAAGSAAATESAVAAGKAAADLNVAAMQNAPADSRGTEADASADVHEPLHGAAFPSGAARAAESPASAPKRSAKQKPKRKQKSGPNPLHRDEKVLRDDVLNPFGN